MSCNGADQGLVLGSPEGALLGALLSVFATRVGFMFGRTLRDSRNTGGSESSPSSSSDDGSLKEFSFNTGVLLIPFRLESRVSMQLSSSLVAFGSLWDL